MSDASISDSTFIDCIFEETVFRCVNLSNCQFENCVFEQFPIDESTVSLNTFIHCQIKNTNFTDSFYYQIFNECDFINVSFQASLLGYNFGFSTDIISQLKKCFNLQDVENIFIDNKLFINAAILRINQTQDQYDCALVACSKAINQMITSDIMIKSEEIQFLKNLTIFFNEKKQIAPISLIQIWQNLHEIISSGFNNIAINKALPHIREYLNTLYLSFQNFLEKLQSRLSRLPQGQIWNDTVELKIVYNEKPTFPLEEILFEVTNLKGDGYPLPKLIRTLEGSYIEFIRIATIIMPYIQTFFSILGVFVPIAIYYEEKKEHKRNIIKEKEQKKQSTSPQKVEIIVSTVSSSAPILLPSQTIIEPITNTIVSDILKVIGKNNYINEVGFGGYNSQNVKSITILFQ